MLLFLYIGLAMDFPLKPETKSQVWDIEAHLNFEK